MKKEAIGSFGTLVSAYKIKGAIIEKATVLILHAVKTSNLTFTLFTNE
jgi:hypothetical protein